MPRPLPSGTWPKASDEADGNAGRPQPGFFRITGKKYFVLYRSQAKNISYPTDHRQNLFRTLPITVKNHFVLYRSQAKNISYSTDHRQKIFRTLPKRYFGLYLLVGGRKPYRLPITLASSLSERS